MTTLSLEVDGNPVDSINIKLEHANGEDPNPWSATVPLSVGTGLNKQDAIEIKRDGVSTFKGLLEVKDPRAIAGSAAIMKISGRHTKVKLWRKWIERYADYQGFWTGTYPNKAVEFLLRPSRSEYLPKETRTRIGWGLNPEDWGISGTAGESDGRGVNKVKTRLDIIGWRSVSNQANGQYIAIDLGEPKDIVAIRVTNKSLRQQEFIRNYAIEASTTGAWGGEEVELATKTGNKAVNIVESWTPGTNYQYIRIKCITAFNDKWTISDIYVYESDGAIGGISVGTIDEHLPLNVSKLTDNVAIGELTIDVQHGWKFNPGDRVILGDDNNEEYLNDGSNSLRVESVDVNRITLNKRVESNVYTTGNDGYLLNYNSMPQLDLDYMRRTEAINTIVGLCVNDSDVAWIWEVTDNGVVNMGERTGTDKSGSISFTRGVNIIDSTAREDDRKKIDRINVIGKGSGDAQDKVASGWVGTGEYEHVEIDKSLESKEATYAKAEQILNKNITDTEITKVRDTYATGTWGIDDNITITDSLIGLSGDYLVKKVTRQYSSSGEMVLVETTGELVQAWKAISRLIKNIRKQAVAQDETIEAFPEEVFGDTTVMYTFEAEDLSLDDDATIITDRSVSGEKYVKIKSPATGAMILGGPGLILQRGSYTVTFMCKISTNVGPFEVIKLNVFSDTSGTLATLQLDQDDFTTSDTLQEFTFSFQLANNVDDVEFTINDYQSGRGEFACDYIKIEGSPIVDYPPGPPAIPTTVSSFGAIEGVIVEWDANTELDLAYYIVYKDVSVLPTSEYVRLQANSLVDKDVTFGTTYYYRIKAVDWAGNISDYSDQTANSPNLIGNSDIDEIDSNWVAIEMRPWTHNMEINWYKHEDKEDEPLTPDGLWTPDFNRIYWGRGEGYTEVAGDPALSGYDDDNDGVRAKVKYGDGNETVINSGTQNGLADGVHFLYWDESDKTSNNFNINIASGVANYGDTTGTGKGLIGIVFIDQTTPVGGGAGQPPTLIPVDSYTPLIGAGIINAHSIISKHITATEWIQSKKFRTASSGSRIEWDVDGIRAYSTVGQTFDVSSTDGSVKIMGTGKFILYEDPVAEPGIPGVAGYLDFVADPFGTGYGKDALALRAVENLFVLDTNGNLVYFDLDENDIIIGDEWDRIRPESDRGVTLGEPGATFIHHIPITDLATRPAASSVPGVEWITTEGLGYVSILWISMRASDTSYDWVQLGITT